MSKRKLQLAGVAAMLIASKYEEMCAPEVADFVYITDNSFSRAQVCEMEILMLKNLNFGLGRPLPLHFLRRASKAGKVWLVDGGWALILLLDSVPDSA